MKRGIFILLTLIFSAGLANAQNGYWSALVNHAWIDADFYSLAVDGDNIYLGANEGRVYLSTDNGQNWEQIGLPDVGPSDLFVLSMAANDNYIFAGTANNDDIGGLYISTNNGSTWSRYLENEGIVSLLVKGTNIFAGTMGNGVYLSTDNGSSWKQTTLKGIGISSLAIYGSNVIAGTTGNGVYLSVDMGSTWKLTDLPSSEYVGQFAINDNIIYAPLYDEGIYFSDDYANTWSKVGSPPAIGVVSLATKGNAIFAGTEHGGVYLSTNNGESWIEKNSGFPDVTFFTIVSIIIKDDDIFVIHSEGGAWRAKISDLTSDVNEEEFDSENNFIYPNPATDYVNVKNYIGWQYEMHDLLGQEVQRGILEASNISVATLPSGMYFLVLRNGAKQIPMKFIKE
ncbi:MAG: T9SS type A sorting domain-containing protein [Methanobacterium sp.]